MPTATPTSATVTGGIDPNLFARAIAPALDAALDQLGEREASAIQQSLSRPVVVHLTNGRTTSIERSLPGEEPRMDHMVLVRHVGHDVEAGESGLPELVIHANRPKEEPDDDADAAEILEYGGVGNFGRIEPRPFMRPALERLRQYAAGFIANVLRVQ